MKFSLIFPLPTSSNWKNGLTKEEIKKIIASNDKRLKDDAKIKTKQNDRETKITF
jgi:hypothetical protein